MTARSSAWFIGFAWLLTGCHISSLEQPASVKVGEVADISVDITSSLPEGIYMSGGAGFCMRLPGGTISRGIYYKGMVDQRDDSTIFEGVPNRDSHIEDLAEERFPAPEGQSWHCYMSADDLPSFSHQTIGAAGFELRFASAGDFELAYVATSGSGSFDKEVLPKPIQVR